MNNTQPTSNTADSPAAYLREITTFLFAIDMRTPPNNPVLVYRSALESRSGNNAEVLRQGFEMAREMGATIV